MSRGLSLPLSLILILLIASATPAGVPVPTVPAGVEPGESWQRVFATSNIYGISSSGSFPPPISSINGLARADWHVSLAAFSAGLLSSWDGVSTPWTAILSTSAVDANTRFAVPGKVFNTADEMVADGFADYWNGSLDTAIKYDEFGVAVSTPEVWSGSFSGGTFSGDSCGDWNNSSGDCNYGTATAASGAWLSSSTQNGSNTARLYGISPVMTLPESADFNGDDVVDGFDFLQWQRGFGMTGVGASHANGDADGNDLIGGLDFGVWESQFGEGSAFGGVWWLGCRSRGRCCCR